MACTSDFEDYVVEWGSFHKGSVDGLKAYLGLYACPWQEVNVDTYADPFVWWNVRKRFPRT